MTSRDSRYRSQAATERRRVETYRAVALDAVAALIVESGDAGWLDLLPSAGEHGDADRAAVAGRVKELRSTLARRSR